MNLLIAGTGRRGEHEGHEGTEEVTGNQNKSWGRGFLGLVTSHLSRRDLRVYPSASNLARSKIFLNISLLNFPVLVFCIDG